MKEGAMDLQVAIQQQQQQQQHPSSSSVVTFVQ
jgi:hypothetical protein